MAFFLLLNTFKTQKWRACFSNVGGRKYKCPNICAKVQSCQKKKNLKNHSKDKVSERRWQFSNSSVRCTQLLMIFHRRAQSRQVAFIGSCMAPNEKPLWCLCNFKIIYNSNEGLISTKRQKGTAPHLGGEKRVGFPFLDIIKEIALPSGCIY